MQMPTKWPTLTVSSSCVRATKGAPTAATLATAADVFKKSLRFMAVSGDRSGGVERFSCITHAMGASRHCIHLRTQISCEDLQMIKMRACCTWKRQDQSAGPVSGRGRQQNGEAQAALPFPEIKARAARIHIEFI